MASKEIMLLSTAQQPYTTIPFRSATADHQSFDPSCDHLLVAVENSIKHAAHMVDTALLEYLEKLEEKQSKANVFSPLLCTIKQLFRNMDKVVVLSERLLLAEKSSITLNLRKMQIIKLCNKRIENMQAEYWEEFPETPKEIFKAFMELIFSDNNLRASLTDASKDKLIEDPNALTQMLWIHMDRILKSFFHRRNEKPQKPTSPDFQKGPHGEPNNFTFYYGSNNEEWINEFEDKARKVIKDQQEDSSKVCIGLCRIRKLNKKGEEARVLSELIKTKFNIDSGKKDPHDFLRHYFESGSDGRFVLTYNQKELLLPIHDDERTNILKVLEEFHKKWNDIKTQNDGFEVSFISVYNEN